VFGLLHDHVIPRVPVRQWVLSLPKRLRGFLHRDPALAGKVLRIFLEEVERELRRQCPGAGAKARTGAVVFPHRFGSSLNANYHFHACVIEGLYEAEGEGVRFHPAGQLSEAAIAQVQQRVRRRVLKAFVRWGLLEAEARDEMLGWQHGGGFSLDASVHIEADDRDGLERLLRYCARPPLAAGHLQWVDARHEQLRYHLPKPMADGTAATSFPGAARPCSRQGVRRAAFIHWTNGPGSPTTADPPPPLLWCVRPECSATPSGHRAGLPAGGSRRGPGHSLIAAQRVGRSNEQAIAMRREAAPPGGLSLGDAVGTHLRALSSGVLALWGGDGDHRLHHRSAERAGHSHPYR